MIFDVNEIVQLCTLHITFGNYENDSAYSDFDGCSIEHVLFFCYDEKLILEYIDD